jgi:hypothetical protein
MRDRQADETLSAERAAGLAGLFWAMVNRREGEPSPEGGIIPPLAVGRDVLASPESTFANVSPTRSEVARLRRSLRGIADVLASYLPTFEEQIASISGGRGR